MGGGAITPVSIEPELGGGRENQVSRDAIKFVAKCIDRLVEFLNLRDLSPHFRCIDKVSADQNPSDDKSDNDEHDGKLNQREPTFAIRERVTDVCCLAVHALFLYNTHRFTINY